LNQPEKKFWKLHVLEATKERIRLARNLEFDSTSKFTARGPWDQEILDEAINQWNDDVLDNAINCEDDDFFEAEYDDVLDNALNCEEYDYGWEDDGPTSCRDIINDCDYEYYYSD
jgi:exonuclease 3'-5' domain-containing protein 1